MTNITKLLAHMRSAPKNVKFSELAEICVHYFGPARQQGTSHMCFKMPWAGDPRVNIQRKGDKAKPYQVKQVLQAIDKLGADEINNSGG